MDHEVETLEQYIEEAQTKFDNRRRLRTLNCQDNIDYHSSESLLDTLDTSIKKNSAFVKRFKVYSESQKAQVIDELERLNSTKFISEIASSLIEAKLKLSDIPSVIEVCTKLNTTYKDFNKQLLDQYSRYFPSVKRKNNDHFSPAQYGHNQSPMPSSNSSHGSISHNTSLSRSLSRNTLESITVNPSKIRVDLRLFAEFIVSGILPPKDSISVLVNLLCYLMIHDKNVYQNANAILTFCKGCGDEFLGLVPIPIEQLANKLDRKLPVSDFIPPKRQSLLRTHLKDYYQSLQRHLNDLHEELNQLVVKNNRACKSRGEISKDSKELVETKLGEFQKLQNVVCQLADLLGENYSELSKIEILEEGAKRDGGEVDHSSECGASASSIWDDEGTRSFYEDLIDLRALFPNLPVKTSLEKKKSGESGSDKARGDSEKSFETGAKSEKVNNGQGSSDSTPTKDVDDDDTDELDKTIGSSSSEESLNAVGAASSSQQTPLMMVQSVAVRTQPDQYFTKLSSCVNRDMIDNAAIDFIKFFNTKFGRRKLVKTLFNVQRTRLDLLPFFARLTATIYPYVPSAGNELTSLLKHDFRNLFKKKDQINIESKVKNVRFIGELVKFGLFPKQEALNCLKLLLSDFTHHHIEMTCNLLETCGRLLFKLPNSHYQLRLLLEQMMRKKMLLSVDSKYITMIENAYYFTNPPEVTRHIVEEPAVHMYVRYLLYECLDRSTIDKVLKKIKMLDWNDEKLAKFVINCMTDAYNLKFYNIRYLAALLAALNKDHQWISIAVIDGVVEDILLMMEINEIQFNQRRIPMIRYFGELYHYRLSDSSLVFKILYSLITYGVHYPQPTNNLSQIPMSHLDAPDNLFRIKLVCDLLDTCGHYLSTGQEKRKLDCYLLFFQRYYWCKKHIYTLHPYCMAKSDNQFPASAEYLYNDTICNLRPTFRMASSYSEAVQSLQNFIDKLKKDQPSGE